MRVHVDCSWADYGWRTTRLWDLLPLWPDARRGQGSTAAKALALPALIVMVNIGLDLVSLWDVFRM